MIKDPAFWIAIASTVAALIAVFLAHRSNRIAKRALELSEQQAMARNPYLVPYLIDGLFCRSTENNSTQYVFSVSVSNRSDNDNAVSSIKLRVSFSKHNRPSGNLLLQHDETLGDVLNLPGAPPISIPKPIDAHQTIKGWAMFEVDNSLLSHNDIDGYEIRIFDSHNMETRLEPIIVREIEHEKPMA